MVKYSFYTSMRLQEGQDFFCGIYFHGYLQINIWINGQLKVNESTIRGDDFAKKWSIHRDIALLKLS